MTLTKIDLVNQIYKSYENMTKREAVQTVEAFLKIIKSSLQNGDDLMISGFGKFSVKDKNARRGRSPQTGGDLMLDARRVVTFKPSGKLRKRVNGEH